MLRLRGAGVVLVAVAVLTLARHAQAEGAACTATATSATHRLRNTLFCNYDRRDRPTKNHSVPLEVGFHQNLISFVLDEQRNSIQVNSWMTWVWNDVHLTWNKGDYENIESIVVTSADIWVPDIAVYNLVGDLTYQLSDVRCILNSTGNLTCASAARLICDCAVDIEYFPYDRHECNLVIGAWSALGDQVTLKLLRGGISTTDYLPNKDWKLLKTDAKVTVYEDDDENKTYAWATFDYEIESYHGSHITIIIPALVLASMSLAAYALEVSSMERLAMIGLNILVHCFFMNFLGANLTHNGDLVPYIVLFYRDSLILVAMSLVTTFMCKKMIAASSTPPPACVLTLASCLLTSLPAQVILFDEHKGEVRPKDDDAVEKVMESEAWRLLSVLLDRVSFSVILFTFIVLYVTYVY